MACSGTALSFKLLFIIAMKKNTRKIETDFEFLESTVINERTILRVSQA
jgi:hypothetical protein